MNLWSESVPAIGEQSITAIDNTNPLPSSNTSGEPLDNQELSSVKRTNWNM